MPPPPLSASQVSLPLPPWLQVHSTRVTTYDNRKRKKPNEFTDTEQDAGESTDTSYVTYDVPADDTPLTLTPNEAHQYRIAGLAPDQPLPRGKNFPHKPPIERQRSKKKLPVPLVKDLATLKDPLYLPQAAAYHADDLHLKHLSLLTTMMHQCLLNGDFTRAGRAWGLLLREEFRWFPLDMRYSGRWGIGAEVLMRGGVEQNSTREGNTPLPFSKQGFEKAKEYYERLILRHPYSKSAPRSISAWHFYPAMFGLWIYVAQEESKVGRKNIIRNYEGSDRGSDEEDSEFEQRESNHKRTLIATIRGRELQQAQQIAIRMDTLLASPPYSDSADLLEMRGMISLWIGDLLMSSLEPRTMPTSSDPDEILSQYVAASHEKERARKLAAERRLVEINKSKDFFAKAKERDRGVAFNLDNFHFDEDLSWGEDPMDEGSD
ncbi:uncharacterized protein N7483_012992 [Penicillium malachiteum]|uniref:uncharacterized protein n=1 Tax=Penicillium malachiteum TaxID=1324776 RepID=UPI002547369D|nr:uncharacterized protein N7483_012992 [Penicillium malachiteum]KAJ5715811.1 hypothetical protein N7483_012992 [Penicillium malachiteum]